MDEQAVKLECLAIATKVVSDESHLVYLAEQLVDFVLSAKESQSTQRSDTGDTSEGTPLG